MKDEEADEGEGIGMMILSKLVSVEISFPILLFFFSVSLLSKQISHSSPPQKNSISIPIGKI